MIKNTVFSKKSTLNIRGNLIPLEIPKVMGILNITPDSFYEHSRVTQSQALKKAEDMVKNGATFIDVGGYSSRPGAKDISADEEINRIKNIIPQLRNELPEAYVSVDTFRASVAKAAIDHGADVINDISAGELDPDMFAFITRHKVPYILMHMKGKPQTMKQLTTYNNMLSEILDYFQEKVYFLLKNGVSNLILDPGFGFAKTIDQNFELLNKMNILNCLGLPLLAGLSRKSMIYKTLAIDPKEALNGTSILNAMALDKGANILRVHDVKEAIEVIKLTTKTFNS